MLLPSDVARLVLGYLQEEGLSATSRAFINESPNLKEYADYTIGDGTIPACVFSIFGKGLTIILNEYVATKTKESRHEVPVVMTSLWKKLDFTLNQIKSLQNSPVISACQRARSRIGVANMARQRVLTVASAGAVVCSSVSETSTIVSPAHTTHSMLIHSTPLSYAASHTRPAAGSGAQQPIHDVRINAPRESPVQMIVSDQRLNPGPMSPGRRKWDTPRKRAGAVSGSSGPGRYGTTVSSNNAEPQHEEAVDESFPQIVIQNARDKILGDRSLQEKLAENINKILASDPVPQTSKPSSSTVEADQSIDEILGLQGEIHMTDDAIHDILEQTESDPAFQALYDLFDYNKTKFTDGEPEVGYNSGIPEESDTALPSPVASPRQSDDPGSTHKDAYALDTTSITAKMKTGQERKTRKSTAPTLLKKTVLGPSGRSSRIENSSVRLLVSHGEHRRASSAAADSNGKDEASHLNNSVFVTPMDIDEPLNTPPPLLDSLAVQEPVSKDSTSISNGLIESTTVSSSEIPAAFTVPVATLPSHVDRKQEDKQAHDSTEQLATAPLAQSDQALLPPVTVEMNNDPNATANLPQIAVSSSEGDAQPLLTLSATSETASSISTATPSAATSDSPHSVSTSVKASAVSSTHPSPEPSACCATVGAAPDPPISNHTSPGKSEADSNVVPLKIIISDSQDEDSSSDPALTGSSTSGEKIPTIYLSTPTKSPVGSGTPKPNSDEVAQAVSGLQSSEMLVSPLGSKAGALVACPLTRTSQVQQNYIIQLPLDTATPAIQATANYFLVTEPPTSDAQTRQVLLSAGVPNRQPVPISPYGVTTQTRSQGYPTGSTLILPSPAKPAMLPVSVMGQSTLGTVQMMSNQLVAIPNAVPVQQSEAVKPKSPTVAVKWATTAGSEQHLIGNLVQPVSTEKGGQQETAKAPKHRRILCFESSAEIQPKTAKTTTALPPATNASTPQSVEQLQKVNKQPVARKRPTILGGNKPKRRVQIVSCLADPQTDGSFMKEAEKPMPPHQHKKDPVKSNSQKQDHSFQNQETHCAGTTSVNASQTDTDSERSKSKDGKHSHDKDIDGAKAKDSHSSRSVSSDSGTRKEKEENSKKEPAEKAPAKSREGRTEKRVPSQDLPSVTANKENEMKGSMQEQQSAPSSSASKDFSPQAGTQAASNSQSKASKVPSKTSSLAKQAAEMLHDIQGHNSPSTPVKRAAVGSSDLSLSGHGQEESGDCPRTPSRQKKGKDGEGTPKHPMPPNTPDVPTCSPASETGSENSINMAAHTLMILSRAAIARTGTPLKNSLRQEGAGEKSSAGTKNSKKRKLSTPTASPPAKKDREKKNLIDCFPHDLDVDKFLSSLHYDE